MQFESEFNWSNENRRFLIIYLEYISRIIDLVDFDSFLKISTLMKNLKKLQKLNPIFNFLLENRIILKSYYFKVKSIRELHF